MNPFYLFRAAYKTHITGHEIIVEEIYNRFYEYLNNESKCMRNLSPILCGEMKT